VLAVEAQKLPHSPDFDKVLKHFEYTREYHSLVLKSPSCNPVSQPFAAHHAAGSSGASSAARRFAGSFRESRRGLEVDPPLGYHGVHILVCRLRQSVGPSTWRVRATVRGALGETGVGHFRR
jgi:hypothetical protein